jgi:hypothetical protein
VEHWWLRLVLLGIVLGVTLHLLRIKTLSGDAAVPCSEKEGGCGAGPG